MCFYRGKLSTLRPVQNVQDAAIFGLYKLEFYILVSQLLGDVGFHRASGPRDSWYTGGITFADSVKYTLRLQ